MQGGEGGTLIKKLGAVAAGILVMTAFNMSLATLLLDGHPLLQTDVLPGSPFTILSLLIWISCFCMSCHPDLLSLVEGHLVVTSWESSWEINWDFSMCENYFFYDYISLIIWMGIKFWVGTYFLLRLLIAYLLLVLLLSS